MARLDEPKTRSTGLWRHANFLRLWTGQTISQFGSQITLLALPLTAISQQSRFSPGLLCDRFADAPYCAVRTLAVSYRSAFRVTRLHGEAIDGRNARSDIHGATQAQANQRDKQASTCWLK
jgi:hypothetical protein